MQALKCPACNGTHFTVARFRRYSGGQTSSTVGPGLMPLSDPWVPEWTPGIVCLCGRVFAAPRPREGTPVSLKQSLFRAQSRRQTIEERLQSWAAQLADAGDLDKCKQQLKCIQGLIHH